MENVADALRMAFGVLVFVIAMAIALSLLSQANATTNQIFYNMDKTTYLEQAVGPTEDANHRIVGMETIIPTIYRYSVENMGVTIVRKVSGKYQLVARYDLDTDSVANEITNTKMFDKGGDYKDTYTYVKAAMSYYRHIDYLINTLKVDNELIFKPSSTKIGFFAENDELIEEYNTNSELQNRINELYEYRYENRRSAEAYYGTTPWTDNIAKRLERDLSGSDLIELNGRYYGIANYGTATNLLSYLKNKKFKEYIIEVSNGEITEEDILQGNDSGKLEIIYVEQ